MRLDIIDIAGESQVLLGYASAEAMVQELRFEESVLVVYDDDEWLWSIREQRLLRMRDIDASSLSSLSSGGRSWVVYNIDHEAMFDDKKTRISVVKKLADDSSERVRRAVAMSAYTPVDVLVELSSDASWRVLAGVAKNRNTPYLILKKLASNSTAAVCESAKENPNYRADAKPPRRKKP